MSPLIRIERLARLLDLSLPEVQRMVASGDLPRPVILPSGEPRWRSDEVEDWMLNLPTFVPQKAGGPDTRAGGPDQGRTQGPDQKAGGPEVGPDPHGNDENPEDDGGILATQIVRILTKTRQWMAGAEIAKAIGESADHTSGHFRRTVKYLRETGQIRSDPEYGYRAKDIDSS
jgi:predicted DNA-binding transcriptional regulator AlpA